MEVNNLEGYSCGGVVVNRKRRVLLIESLNHFNGEFWTFPKGKFDPDLDQTLEDTVRREVLEETGWKCEVLFEIPYVFPVGEKKKYFLMVPVERVGDPAHLGTEVERVTWVRFRRVEDFLSQSVNPRTMLRNRKIWFTVTRLFSGMAMLDPVCWINVYDGMVKKYLGGKLDFKTD